MCGHLYKWKEKNLTFNRLEVRIYVLYIEQDDLSVIYLVGPLDNIESTSYVLYVGLSK